MDIQTFTEKRTLACRGPIDQLADESCHIMVSDQVVCRYGDNHSHFGFDDVAIQPAKEFTCEGKILGMKRCWLKTEIWESAAGYNCSGLKSEAVIPFRDGVEILLDKGAFEHLWK